MSGQGRHSKEQEGSGARRQKEQRQEQAQNWQQEGEEFGVGRG